MKNINFRNTIIFKTLLSLSLSLIMIFALVYSLFYENSTSLIRDIEKRNTDYLINTLNSRKDNSLKVDVIRVKKDTRMTARHASEYLQNFDKEGLKDILKHDIQGKGIMLIQIWDNELNDVFLLSFMENGKVVFGKNIPEKFKKFKKFKAPIKSTTKSKEDIIGEALIYYDNSHIINEISLLKEKFEKDILVFNVETDDRLYDFIKTVSLISIIGLFIILLVVAMIFKNLVNNPLKKLKLGLDDFFLFIQRKKNTIKEIDISSRDEFGDMVFSLNESIEINAKFLEDIHKLNVALEIKTKKEQVLLDNASQGFLTFDENLIIDNTYSIKCEEMLGSDIANKNIIDILFPENDEHTKRNRKLLLDTLKIDNKIAQKSMLTLLSSQIVLNKMHLKLEYIIVEDMRFMLIITNQTNQKKLEGAIQKEQNILKMIISVIKDRDIFYDVKKDFENFTRHKTIYINIDKSPLENLNELYRIIHTFKGLFLQLLMCDTAHNLHTVESQLSHFLTNKPQIINEEISNFIDGVNFNAFIDNDCDNISKLLGKAFVNNNNSILVDGNTIQKIKDKYISLLESLHIETKLSKELLDNIMELLQKPLLAQLDSYPSFAMQLAQKLGKEIYEFEVIGSKDTVIPENFKPFIKSLVHIFRNTIDHGIETAEERMELEKDNIGTITCSFDVAENNLQIIISDDGAGIDVEKLKSKIPKEVDVSKLSDDDIYLYVFKEYISTKDQVTNTSGRGIGMSVVKLEIEKLGGTIEIQSKINIGATFIFNVPFKERDDKC